MALNVRVEEGRSFTRTVVLEGRLPAGTAVQVRTLTAESDEPPDLLALRPPEEWALAGTC